MAFLTLGTLLKTTSKATALQTLIDILDSVGFNSTSWQDGSIQLTFLEMSATLLSDFTEISASIASFGFLDTSVGEALTAFSDSNYDNQRFVATRTIGDIAHVTAAGEGPHVIAIGALVVQDNVHGFTYRNITAGTLTSAVSSVTLSYQAEVAGADKNVPNTTIDTLNTPLAGVTVSNVAVGGPPALTWVTSAAVDIETDADLRVRDRTRWASLSIATPADAYNNIARNSTAAITRSTVDANNPRGAGTVDIYVAGPLGLAGGTAVADAQAAIDLRRPVTADPLVLDPTGVAFTPAATVYITAALNTEAERIAIEQSILDYINVQPIGGTDFGGGGIVSLAVLSQTVTDFTSVVHVVWTVPAVDIALGATGLSTVNFLQPLGQNLTFTDV